MTDKLIADGWEDFRKQCIDADATESDIASTKMVFYSGCLFMLKTMGSLTTLIVGDQARIDAIKQELTDYHREIDRETLQ